MSSILALPERSAEIVARWVTDRGVPYRREVPIKGYRLDFVADWDHVLLALEVDEKQHLAYEVEREITRTNALLSGLEELHQADPQRKPILLVRFNPDSYLRVEETKNPTLENRLTVLGMFLDQYQPKPSQPIACAYFCYDTDLLCNLTCPFLAGNERIKLITFPILADPDAVSQLPQKQLKVQLRAQRKLKHVDPRDLYIEALRAEVKEKDQLAHKLKEEVKATKRKVEESEAELRPFKESKTSSDELLQNSSREVSILLGQRRHDDPGPKAGAGGIFLTKRVGQRPAFSVQYRSDGKLRVFHVPTRIVHGFSPKRVAAVQLRKFASELGMTAEAIDRSLLRMKLL